MPSVSKVAPSFKFWTNSHWKKEKRQEICAIGGYLKVIFYCLLQSVIATWKTREFVRRERWRVITLRSWRSGVWFPTTRDVSFIQNIWTVCEVHSASYSIGSAVLSPSWSSPGVKSNTYTHPAPRLRMRGAIPPLPRTASWREQGHLKSLDAKLVTTRNFEVISDIFNVGSVHKQWDFHRNNNNNNNNNDGYVEIEMDAI